MTAHLIKWLSFDHITQTSLLQVRYVDADCTQPERKRMSREMLAEWLRDISSLIRDVSVDDALSDEGLTRKKSSPSRSTRQVVPHNREKKSATRH
jgi:hypothetical protein